MTTRLTDEQIAELERLMAGAWPAPWVAHTFEIDCPCPNGEDCGDLHTCEQVEAPEAYPASPEDPAEPGDGQCVVQISVPGLESLAGPNAAFIARARNALPSLLAEVRAARASATTGRDWCRACRGSGEIPGPHAGRCTTCGGTGLASPPANPGPSLAEIAEKADGYATHLRGEEGLQGALRIIAQNVRDAVTRAPANPGDARLRTALKEAAAGLEVAASRYAPCPYCRPGGFRCSVHMALDYVRAALKESSRE